MTEYISSLFEDRLIQICNKMVPNSTTQLLRRSIVKNTVEKLITIHIFTGTTLIFLETITSVEFCKIKK